MVVKLSGTDDICTLVLSCELAEAPRISTNSATTININILPDFIQLLVVWLCAQLIQKKMDP
ncbi:MAG: hypothetical protein DRP64_00585 [Verrucomicrobia bacterium]|nr:MAG: hypothetical protein DRP64_00585 [Verrucomicrobiota bacterium]